MNSHLLTIMLFSKPRSFPYPVTGTDYGQPVVHFPLLHRHHCCGITRTSHSAGSAEITTDCSLFPQPGLCFISQLLHCQLMIQVGFHDNRADFILLLPVFYLFYRQLDSKFKSNVRSRAASSVQFSGPEYHQPWNMEGKSIVHSEEKLYRWFVCGQGFSQSSGLSLC